MEAAISFFVTVMAGMVCHLVCKWLDRNNEDNEYPTGYFTSIKKEKSLNCAGTRLGDFILCPNGLATIQWIFAAGQNMTKFQNCILPP